MYISSKLLKIAGLSALVGAAVRPAPAQTAQQWLENPFTWTSAHHRPIGTGAIYESTTDPATDCWMTTVPSGQDIALNFGAGGWGCTAWLGVTADPQKTVDVLAPDPDVVVTNYPDGAAGDLTDPPAQDAVGVILDSGVTPWKVHQFRGWFWNDGAPTAKKYKTWDIKGVGHGGTWNGNASLGTSASGVAALFGVLRGWEVNDGGPKEIKHALQMVIPRVDGGPSYLSREAVWPAMGIDGTSGYPNNTGAIPYGSLFAIPASVDVEALNIHDDAKVLARALQRYGVYVIDGGGQPAIRTDQEVALNVRNNIKSGTGALWYLMRRVANNVEGTDTAGGGSPIAGAVNSAWDAPVQAVFTSIDAEDGHVPESGETTNVGSNVFSAWLKVGDGPSDNQLKSFVSFDTSSIPDTATILSVELRLTRNSLVGSNPFTLTGFTPCKVDYKSGGFNGSTTLEAADFQAAATTTNVVSAGMSNPTTDGAESVGAVSTSAVNKTGKSQYRIYFSKDDNDDMGDDYIQFYGGDASGNNRPRLIVTYQP